MHLSAFRACMTEVAKHKHIVAIGVGGGLLDSHFMAVWEDQYQLELHGKQIHNGHHFVLLRRCDAEWFQNEVLAQTSDRTHMGLRHWMQRCVKIVVYGHEFEELTPFVKHMANAVSI